MKDFRMDTRHIIVVAILILLMVHPGAARETGKTDETQHPSFGGPDTVEIQMESDRAEKDALYESRLLKPYFEWQAGIKETYGLSFGGDYSSVYLKASDNLPGMDDSASSGMFRLYASWELLGRGTDTTGTLVYKVEHRHRYGDIAPSGLSIGSLGNVGVIEPPFSNQETRLTNLYWRQSWNQGNIVALAGFLDATDFVDVYALTSPWLHFTNFAFGTGAATISLPEDATLGVAAGAWLNDSIYIIGGLEDTNSDPTDPFEGPDTFFNDHEYFKHIEIGCTTSKKRAYLDNLHLTLWHVDEREKAGVEDGWGAVLSFSRYINDRWMPFLRGGYADDGGSLLQKSVSAGIGYQPNPVGSAPGNLLGIAGNWGQPNEAIFGSGLDDQYSAELFYRVQVTREFAVTPSAQLLIDPALNPDENTIAVFGLRARVAF
ncbi:MAG: carbohydrate porin [Planctomycetota bacterium]|jgi:porin